MPILFHYRIFWACEQRIWAQRCGFLDFCIIKGYKVLFVSQLIPYLIVYFFNNLHKTTNFWPNFAKTSVDRFLWIMSSKEPFKFNFHEKKIHLKWLIWNRFLIWVYFLAEIGKNRLQPIVILNFEFWKMVFEFWRTSKILKSGRRWTPHGVRFATLNRY